MMGFAQVDAPSIVTFSHGVSRAGVSRAGVDQFQTKWAWTWKTTAPSPAQRQVQAGMPKTKFLPVVSSKDKKPVATSESAPKASAAKDVRQASFDKPPTKWPRALGALDGGMEVRVKNPNNFQVRVGLRAGGKGKDFVVSPNGTETVRVPNGRYDIYFHYSSDPEGLYQGDSFTLNDNGVEIQIVKVVNGNYGIRKVK